MSNNEISIKVENIDESQIPELIQSQFAQMGELKKEIAKATNSAYEAKENVVLEVGEKGMGKKEAIENLQGATLNLANAQIDAMRAQKKSFEYQQKLGEISKFLFRLGLTNISMNRVVVKELEFKLREASQDELDELARAEIENLLKRLKTQQDIDQKQTELTALVKEQYDLNEQQEREIAAQAEKDDEHDRRINELFDIIVKQGEIIEAVLLEVNEIKDELLEKERQINLLQAEMDSITHNH